MERNSFVRQALSVLCIGLLLVFSGAAPLSAQQQQPAPPPSQLLSPDQLDALVAPIALYPDALLSQVLVASTYPLEVVEAGQWRQQNPNLQGQQLVDAARQQNWDASVQALVVFPDVLARLNSNIRWTTDLGNAFLAQQADVMNAIQRLRAQAQAAGHLSSNPEETIATNTEGGQTAIDIQPTNPDVMYVPEYNPVDVWGPPPYGYYPDLYYPDFGWGFGFYPAIYIGGFFGGLGWGGWGGWGWGCNWFGGSVFLNGGFFHHYGFRGFGGRGFNGRQTWAHNPEHRMGVAYPNQTVANRFGGNFAGRGRVGSAGFASMNRGNFASSAPRTSQFRASTFRNSGLAQSYRAPSAQSYHSPSFGGSSAFRSSPAYNNNFSAGRSLPTYRSAPSFNNSFRSGNSGFRSAPSFGAGHSAAPSFHSFGDGFRSGGGGGFHASSGGFHGGGGSGFHGGGGGFHGGGGRR